MVIGDVLRVLPHIVTGLVQGTRLRKELEEAEKERYWREQERQMQAWEWEQRRLAIEQQRKLTEGFSKWLETALKSEPVEEETEEFAVTFPSAHPIETIQPPQLQVPTGITIRQPRRRTTIPTFPTPQLTLPSTIQPPQQPQPIPTAPLRIDASRVLTKWVGELQRLVNIYEGLQGWKGVGVPSATFAEPQIAGMINQALGRVELALMARYLQEGKATDLTQVRLMPEFWNDLISILRPYSHIPIVQAKIGDAQRERDFAFNYQRRKEDLDFRKTQATTQAFMTLARFYGTMGENWERRVDRLMSFWSNIEGRITDLIMRAHQQQAITPQDLRMLRDMMNMVSPALSVLGKDQWESVYNLLNQTIQAIEQQRQDAANLMTTLIQRLQGFRDFIARRIISASVMANYFFSQSEQMTHLAVREIVPQTAAMMFRDLGVKDATPAMFYHDFQDFNKALESLPEEPEETLTPVPTQPPARPPELPAEEARTQAPTPQPPTSQPPQPTPQPPTQPPQQQVPPLQTLGRIAFLGAMGRAEEERLRRAREQIRMEMDRIRLQYLGPLLQLSVRRQQVGLAEAQQRMIQRNLEIAQEQRLPPELRTILERGLTQLGSIIRGMTKEDGSPLGADEVLKLSAEGFAAFAAWVMGNSQPLNQFLSQLRQQGYRYKGSADILSALFNALGLAEPTTPTAPIQQQKQPTQSKSPSQKGKTSLFPLSPEERDIENLFGF